MSKKITIKEEDIEPPPEESRDDIIQQVSAPPPPSPPPPAAEPPTQQKADSKMRMRELYKCDGCGKYLTKKSLNYSHQNTCKGNPANQAKPPPKQCEEPVTIEYVEEATPVKPPEPPPLYHNLPLYQQMAIERRRAHLEKIERLKRFIV